MNTVRMILCMMFFYLSSACYIYASGADGLSFSLSKDGEAIKFILSNESKRDVIAMLPFGVSLDNALPGVELVIRDSLGNKRRLCAFINSSKTPERLVVKSGDSYTENMELEYIKTIFCLEPGPYRAIGIYHNVVSKYNNYSLESDEVEINIK